MTVRVLTGDVFERLSELPDESVHCAVTSPPYFGLRDYGVAGAIGLEPTFDEHLDVMVRVFREVRRVLRNDGTCWLNYGDAYAGSWGAQSRGNPCVETSTLSGGQVYAGAKGTHTGSVKRTPGLKPKDLLMMPARIALALQSDGWWLRSEIIWHKVNPMPESVRDRPTSAHEKMYLLTKAARYFYDVDAVRTVAKYSSDDRKGRASMDHKSAPDETRNGMRPRTDKQRGHGRRHAGFNERWDAMPKDEQQTHGANLRNVWTFATEPYRDAHFAVMPTAIVEPCIQAGTSEKGCCERCGKPWVRVTEPAQGGSIGQSWHDHSDDNMRGQRGTNCDGRAYRRGKTSGWSPSCECAADTVPCTVLDPFGGSGTVGLVADRLGRDAILIELNPDYADMARERIRADAPLFAEVV